MSDEYTIDAKYKRDNLLDEHFRYQRALERIRDEYPWHVDGPGKIAHDALTGVSREQGGEDG